MPITPRKSLGQHFLHDPSITARIAQAAAIAPGTHVIEVGPGPGGLTRALLATPAETIIAVEFDPRAVAAIDTLRVGHEARLTVLHEDALNLDLTTLAPAPRQIVANLPYNIATPLLVGWLRQAAQWQRMTLMFQAEVADRIAAPPGGSAYGRLSVLAQWCCEVSVVLKLPPGAFTPPPKVWSAVVDLVPRAVQPETAQFAAMEAMTAAAFGQRRKMLRGALRSVGGEALLAAAGIDGQRRAETLSVAEFELLCRRRSEGLCPPASPIGAAGPNGCRAKPCPPEA